MMTGNELHPASKPSVTARREAFAETLFSLRISLVVRPDPW